MTVPECPECPEQENTMNERQWLVVDREGTVICRMFRQSNAQEEAKELNVYGLPAPTTDQRLLAGEHVSPAESCPHCGNGPADPDGGLCEFCDCDHDGGVETTGSHPNNLRFWCADCGVETFALRSVDGRRRRRFAVCACGRRPWVGARCDCGRLNLPD